jgi:hypothetical protein
MTPDMPYEDETFVELQKIPAVTKNTDGDRFCFVIQHKGSEVIYEVIAKDREELAVKIAAGQYADIDPRNDKTPAHLDEDATDE